MQILAPTSAGKVVALQGRAVARGPDGRLRLLAVGDWVASDEVIVAAQNGYVQLASDDAAAVRVAALGADVALAAMRAPSPASAPAFADASGTADLARSIDSGANALTAGLRVATATDGPGGAADLVRATPATGWAQALGTSAAPTTHASSAARLAPWAASQQLSGTEDTPLPISLTGHDADGRIGLVWVVKVPTGGLLYQPDGVPIADRTPLTPAAAGALVFVPAPDFHGNPGVLQYFVVDATGRTSAVQTVSIDLASVNDAPRPGTVPLGPDNVAIDDPAPAHVPGTGDYHHDTVAGAPVRGAVAATDVDRDALRYGTDEAPAHGQVAVAADGAYVYTPVAGYQGSDRFVVGIDDGHGGHARSTVTIDVGANGTAVPQSSGDVFAWRLADPQPVSAAPAAHAAEPVAPATGPALDLRDLLPSDGAHDLLFHDAVPSAPAVDVYGGGLALDLGYGAAAALQAHLPSPWNAATSSPDA